MYLFSGVTTDGEDSAYSRARSTFAVMPSTVRSASSREALASSRTDSSRFLRDHRQHHVQLEVPGRARAAATVASLPVTWAATIRTASGITGLTLPGMIEEPGWRSGRVISARPVRGPGGHPAQVVADLGEAHRDGPQLARGLHQAVARALRLEVVARLGQRQPGGAGDLGDDGGGEAGRGVDAGAHGRAAQREFGQPGQRGAQPLDAVADLRRVARRTPGRGSPGWRPSGGCAPT